MTTALGIDIKTSLRELKDGLKWAASFAGAPVELVRLGRIERAMARTLASWLGRLERLADTLVTALAAELGPAPAAAPKPDPAGLFARLAKSAEGRDLDEADSRRWRGVSYAAVFGREPAARSPARGRRPRRRAARLDPAAHDDAGDVPAAPLARRLEALIRIAEAPRRFARRLLRRAARRAARARRTPRRSFGAARPAWLRPKLPPPRIRWIDTS